VSELGDPFLVRLPFVRCGPFGNKLPSDSTRRLPASLHYRNATYDARKKMPRNSLLIEAILRKRPLRVIQQIVDDDPESVRRPVDVDDDDDGDNWYPLHEAVVAGASVDVIRFLVYKHPQALREGDKRGWLPLHLAVQPRPKRLRRHGHRHRHERDDDDEEEALGVIRFLCRQWPAARRRRTNGGWDAGQIASHFGNWEAARVVNEPMRRWEIVDHEQQYDTWQYPL
jgi:ankyrin repeat protein